MFTQPSSRRLSWLAVLAVALGACSSGSPPPPAQPPEVGVITLTTQSVSLQSQLIGRTTASLVSEVRPQVTGIVKTRNFTEGSDVKAGDVLYEIDPAQYRAAHAAAQADLANAEAAVSAAQLRDERYSELLEIDGVSRQEADDARTSHQQSLAAVASKKAALERARIDLDYTQVRAPISGRIGKSTVTPGALVTANQIGALATIHTLDPIHVDLTQSSTQLLRLRRLLESRDYEAGGTQVRLTLEDGTQYSHPGVLQFREVAVDENTGSVTLRALFPNPEGSLLPGMYVRAMLEDAVDPQGLLVPQQGIGRDPRGNATALVVNEAGTVESRIVQTLRAVGNQWLVSEGLQPGDRLIVEGSGRARPGMQVQVVELDFNTPNPDA